MFALADVTVTSGCVHCGLHCWQHQRTIVRIVRCLIFVRRARLSELILVVVVVVAIVVGVVVAVVVEFACYLVSWFAC